MTFRVFCIIFLIKFCPSENPLSKINVYFFARLTKSIGTSMKNFDTSDMISIDIDPESTRLPLMCKLMIIVEGAALERGQRVLVCDAGIQVGDDEQLLSKEASIPVIKVNADREADAEADKREARRAASTAREMTTSEKTNNKYRSSESLAFETTSNKMKKSAANSARNSGSLSNLLTHHACESVSIYSDDIFNNTSSSNYFSKKSTSGSGRKRVHSSNHTMQSYLDLCEYNSAPYYQYQRKNWKKNDFSCNLHEHMIDELLVYRVIFLF